jgi:ferrous iron transport protein A
MNIISSGKRVEIVKVLGGCCFMKRLEEMGILPGSAVEVVQNNGGPVMLGIGNSRFAIGQGAATRIYVKEIN